MSKFWHIHFPRVLLAIMVLALIALVFSCTTNKKLLREIREVKARLAVIDSTYNHTQIQLYYYEKARIDSVYNNISDADLLQRIDDLTKPKPKNKP